MLKVKNVKVIDLYDWDELVKETYGKHYSFQQQHGCQPRGMHNITIPSDDYDDEMHDTIAEGVNGAEMGVKFKTWLERDPKASVCGRTDYHIGMFWERNFYPDLQTVANDLHAKGLIEAGDYVIEIDW